MVHAPADAPQGRLLDGRYRVGERIAAGGMATVYTALDTRLDRTVALKVMRPQLAEDHDFVTRFIGEARSAARLSHPHAVAVYDQGEDGEVVYLVMEYVHGRNLREVLREHGRLDPATALEMLEPVLAALSAAHAAGIVHRDVKPENVLVGEDGRVKVADFGLARAVTSNSTATRGLLLGTVAYVSPEQALGEAATPRSDVYAAGIMLYELLVGVPPHSGATDYMVVRSHIEDDVPRPSLTRRGVPTPVDELVLRATRRDPAERYADAGAFLAAVRRARGALVGAPVDAEPLESAGVSAADAMAVLAAGGVGEQTTVLPTAGRRRTDTQPELARRPPSEGGSATTRIDRTGRDPRRRRRGIVGFLVVLLLATGVAAGAWWLGAGRYTSTPSLLRLEAAAAEQRAARSGLEVAVADDRRFSETVAEGLVLETDPGPGERVLRGGTVRVVLSAGPERYAVPPLVGSTLAEAEAALAEANLVAGERAERFDDEAAAGVVVEQGTDPGEQLRRGSAVDLVVSKGPEPVEIPDVTGRAAGAAQEQLEEAGFTVARADDEFSDDIPEGQVIRQEPAAGGTGVRGDEVTLVVSKGPDVVDVPQVSDRPLEEARAALERLGLRPKEVVLLPAGPGNVLRQSPGAGTTVRRGSEVTLYVF